MFLNLPFAFPFMSKCQAQTACSFSMQNHRHWPPASRLLSVFSCLLYCSSSGWKTFLEWQSWQLSLWYPGMGKWEFILVVWCLHVYFGHQGGGRLLKQLCGICSMFSLMLSPKRVNREWNVEPELWAWLRTWLEVLSPVSKSCWERSCPHCPHLLSLLCCRRDGRSSVASSRDPHGAPGMPLLPQEIRSTVASSDHA